MTLLTIISQGEGHVVGAFYNHLQANCGALSNTLAEADLVSVSTVSARRRQTALQKHQEERDAPDFLSVCFLQISHLVFVIFAICYDNVPVKVTAEI